MTEMYCKDALSIHSPYTSKRGFSTKSKNYTNDFETSHFEYSAVMALPIIDPKSTQSLSRIHKISKKINKSQAAKFSSDVVAALAWEKSHTEKIRHARETLNRKLQPLELKDTKSMYKEYTFVPYDPHYRNYITSRGVQQCLQPNSDSLLYRFQSA